MKIANGKLQMTITANGHVHACLGGHALHYNHKAYRKINILSDYLYSRNSFL